MEISSTFVYVSLTLWQIGFIVGILLKLFYKPNEKKVFKNISTPKAVEVELPQSVKKEIGHVDIQMRKNIALQKPTTASVKSDEVIKGKVSTQKDKLKQIRRG
tara:strand:+ start:1315 stop:1623 length:309 start_codon:yes stop_codon:yes gene_type:complete